MKKFIFSGWSVDRWFTEDLKKVSLQSAAAIFESCPEYVQESADFDSEDVSVFTNEDGKTLLSVGPCWSAWIEEGPELSFPAPAPETETETETETEEEAEAEAAAFMASLAVRPPTPRGRGWRSRPRWGDRKK